MGSDARRSHGICSIPMLITGLYSSDDKQNKDWKDDYTLFRIW